MAVKQERDSTNTKVPGLHKAYVVMYDFKESGSPEDGKALWNSGRDVFHLKKNKRRKEV
jgi:hypothetical protein